MKLKVKSKTEMKIRNDDQHPCHHNVESFYQLTLVEVKVVEHRYVQKSLQTHDESLELLKSRNK